MLSPSTQPPSQPPSTAFYGCDGSISTIHPDVLQTHILTRLDGPTLAAASCASSELHSLSTDERLWRKICTSTWPSINDPRVSQVISTFPSGHRSFFSDSYPLIYHDGRHQNLSRPATTELISAVDIYYRDVPIFSKVVETETVTGWFLCSPFRVDLLEPKEYVETSIQQALEDESRLKELEENITLSWILIDPKQKLAVNVSSRRPVSAERHWLTGEVRVKFATVMGGGGVRKISSEREYVECEVVVTCGGEQGGEVHVRDVSLGMLDMEGKNLSGKDSLVILQEAAEVAERRTRNDGKERFAEFVERKRDRKERKQRKEKVLDMVCIAAGVTIFVGFCCFLFFR